MLPKRMPQELADEILRKIEITYNRLEVEEWYESLTDGVKTAVKEFVMSFTRVYPNYSIYAFNMYMQFVDDAVYIDGTSITRSSNYDEIYRSGSSRHHCGVVQQEREVVHAQSHEEEYKLPGERIFDYLQGFVRTPHAEYQAFSSVRDLGENMQKMMNKIDNLERK